MKASNSNKKNIKAKKINKKNIILFIGSPVAVMSYLPELRKSLKPKYRLGLLFDPKNIKPKILNKVEENFDIVIQTCFDKKEKIVESLKPYESQIKAVTCRSESNIPAFIKTIPHIPYVKTPTTASLNWAIDKIKMREQFTYYDPKITPKFLVIKSFSKSTISEISKKVGFPLIIKPTGLAASRLVNIAFHKEELETSLKRVFKSINKVYREEKGRGEPKVLVEQFLEGKLYSIEAFVNSLGKIYFTPMVEVTTGYEIGFDDFFGYKQITPSILSDKTISGAKEVASKAIRAIGLRSSTAHVELLKTEQGWKVIEIGPRVGGFRHDLYKLAYDIDVSLNDVLIRIPKMPKMPKKCKGYAAALKFFAKKEGTIKNIIGVKKVQELKSFKKIFINKKVGDRARYAKNGGSSIFNILLFNKERSKLLADIRRLEKSVKIETFSRGSSNDSK